MKAIDEKELLLAVGQVGDDLLARAEHPAGSMPAYKRWGTLAACLCLVLCLGAYSVMGGFRLGSSGTAEMEDNSAVSGETAPGDLADGNQYGDCTGEEDALPEKGADVDVAYYDGAACLKELGVTGPGIDILSVDGETFRETAGNKSEAASGTTEPVDPLYGELCAADVTAAGEAFEDAVAVVLELPNGETLEGAYSPERGCLRLGEYDFCSERLRGYFERSDGT